MTLLLERPEWDCEDAVERGVVVRVGVIWSFEIFKNYVVLIVENCQLRLLNQ